MFRHGGSGGGQTARGSIRAYQPHVLHLDITKKVFFFVSILSVLNQYPVLWSRSNLDRLRLPAPGPALDNNIFVTQIKVKSAVLTFENLSQ